jgi:hypothetical protein
MTIHPHSSQRLPYKKLTQLTVLPQTPCQLCGVSFKIARIRTQSEPREAAWDISPFNPAVPDEGDCWKPGCKVVTRPRDPAALDETTDDDDVFEDVIPSGVDSEGNEVSLRAYMALEGWDPEDFDDFDDFDEEAMDEIWSENCRDYWKWYTSKIPDGREYPFPASDAGLHDPEPNFVEHIAGVDCGHQHGYNGNAISVEEMRLCTTVQCIVEKQSEAHDPLPEWTPESDDEDFERDSKYFLSGLGDRCGSWEDNCTVEPIRHGFNDINPIFTEGFKLGDLAFHPHCFEMFKRVSTLRLGRVDVAKWADWWGLDQEAGPSHPSAGAASDQWWNFNQGDEWLAANPLEIPALTAIFEAAQRQHFNARNSPFGAGEATPAYTDSSDIFGKLPSELRDMVLSSLGSKDIASLRLASRSFYHLPNTLWHDLILKEMPWIWEAWTDRPYPFMACTTKREYREHLESGQTDFRKPRKVRQLDRLQTDWYNLYRQIAQQWRNISGLQNRERIWKSIEYVVRRVENPDEDVDLVNKDHEKRFPHRVKTWDENGTETTRLQGPRDLRFGLGSYH